jgi:hypothetical protein
MYTVGENDAAHYVYPAFLVGCKSACSYIRIPLFLTLLPSPVRLESGNRACV